MKAVSLLGGSILTFTAGSLHLSYLRKGWEEPVTRFGAFKSASKSLNLSSNRCEIPSYPTIIKN